MKRALSLLSLLAAAALDAGALWQLLFVAEPSGAKIISLHLGGVLLMALAAILRAPESYRKKVGTLVALVVAFTLPLPLVGIIALLGLRLLLKIRPSSDPGRNYVIGERAYLTMEKFDASGRAAGQSILDILGSRNNALRRTAILALRAVEAKKALPVLVKAIADSDEQVRLLAQTQFNKIIAALETTIKQMESDLAQMPREPSRLIDLAEQYHELVYLGVSSEETEQLYLDRAIELLRESLEIDPENKGARFFLLKCLIKRGRLEEGETCLADLRRAGFQEDFLRVWRADILYQKRDWAALEQTLHEMRQSKGTDPRLGGMVEFWLGTSGLQTLS